MEQRRRLQQLVRDIRDDLPEVGRELRQKAEEIFEFANLTDPVVWSAAWRLVQRAKKAKTSPGGVLRNGLETFKRDRIVSGGTGERP